VLLRGQTDPAYAPLQALVTALEKAGDPVAAPAGDGDLDSRWAEAIAVLTAFAGAASPDAGSAATPARERKPFWKR
jgi:hypothetical protein